MYATKVASSQSLQYLSFGARFDLGVVHAADALAPVGREGVDGEDGLLAERAGVDLPVEVDHAVEVLSLLVGEVGVGRLVVAVVGRVVGDPADAVEEELAPAMAAGALLVDGPQGADGAGGNLVGAQDRGADDAVPAAFAVAD